MSERGEAERDGTKLQRNSGRGKYAKGDGLRTHFLVDYKEAQKSFNLNKQVWAKVCTDTFAVDKERHPLLKVILGEAQKVRLAIIEWSMLEYMEDRIEELEAEVETLKYEGGGYS